MSYIPRLLLFISTLLFLEACTKDVVDTTGTLAGIVVDSRSGSFLSGALISVSPSGKSSSTGNDGKFEFRDVEAGSYSVSVSKSGYKSDKKSVYVQVGETTNVDFQLTPSTATLNLSTTSLDFNTDATNLTFDISNSGDAPLNWSLAEDASWLTCNPISGTTQAGEKSSVIVKVDRSGMESGSYNHTIAISSNGGSATINVRLTVQGVTVTFTPEQLDFGSVETSKTLSLTNTGTGNVTYSLDTSNSWISLSKKGGTFSQTDNVIVTVSREGLDVGDYNGTVIFTVSNMSESIPVRMNIPVKEKPVVSTISVDDITYNSAYLKGAIVKLGSAAVSKHGFCWSEKQMPTIDDESTCNLGDCNKPTDFSFKALNLNPSTTYYVRAYAENGEGVSYGDQLTFTTSGTPKLAVVFTSDVTEISDSQASVAGRIDNLGNVDKILQYGHVWNKTGNPTINDSKSELGSTNKAASYKSVLSGLNPSTTYHVRAYATNSVGTAYGEEITFRTSSSNEITIEGYGEDEIWKP